MSSAVPEWLDPLVTLAASVESFPLVPGMPAPPPDARPAAVLICFADGEDGPELLLTERTTKLRNHAGQISFPGGASDPEDGTAVVTALREAQEEVGLDPTEVEVFGVLPIIWLPPSNFAVTPVLGYWRSPRELAPVSSDEVHRVLHHPIGDLIDPANRFTVIHPSGWRGPAFEIGTEVPLWGFTAGLISRMFDEVGWARPWDAEITRPVPYVRPASGGTA